MRSHPLTFSHAVSGCKLKLIKNNLSAESQVIESIVRGYQAVYEALETERPDWVPELSLQWEWRQNY
ncbi:hypothetical protein Cri9333_4117 [Crinalium epipsammum PCC 9333]|uniref:Uncharacterized protein n=1 Tax=Crinalium epipsammum PCC 9333 TaxID=1173022 RepID=K9W537_9CYAN|nr:hypothetical protein [Crinalium epipsammum]AFZ14914.1 hypothetical protein Cri9333_4117 [Crinalium epipsammum PCC 9333]